MNQFTLVKHQWKAAMRSATASKSLGIKLIMGFIFVLLFLELLGAGFFIGLHLSDNSENPIAELSQYGFYFFLSILMVRYMLQKLPTFMVKPYLILPIKKSRLVNFVLTKPLFNNLNILPLSFALALMGGLHDHLNSSTFWTLFSIVIVGDLFVNYLGIYIKRIQIKHEFVFYLFLAVIAGVLLLNQFAIVDFSAYSAKALMAILDNPLWLILGLIGFAAAYGLNYNLLFNHFSLEDFGKGDANQRGSLEHITYLERFGKIGAFMLLELKMCVRNKRTRTMIFMAPLFLLYGLMFYTNPTYSDMKGFLIFVGLFISGGFMMSFGLYFFAWESGHFDLMLTANNSYKDYIKAKYFLMLSTSTIIFLISTFYVYFGLEYLYINAVCFLFNIGINSLLLLYFATNNQKHMDLSKGSAFNYQGVSGRHFVLMIPLLVLPIFIYWPFSAMGQANLGLGLIGLLGIVGLLLREKMLNLITQRFMSRRYKMSEGFRNK